MSLAPPLIALVACVGVGVVGLGGWCGWAIGALAAQTARRGWSVRQLRRGRWAGAVAGQLRLERDVAQPARWHTSSAHGDWALAQHHPSPRRWSWHARCAVPAGALPSGVRLRWSAQGGALRLGDPWCDAHMEPLADEALALATLTPATRDALRAVWEAGRPLGLSTITLTDEALELELELAPDAQPVRWRAIHRLIVQAWSLRAGWTPSRATLAERLYMQAFDAQHSEAWQQRALVTLLRGHPGEDTSALAWHRALTCGPPALQLAALELATTHAPAQLTEAQRRDVLARAVEQLPDTPAGDALRVRLFCMAEIDELERALIERLSAPRTPPSARLRVAHALGEVGGPRAARAMVRVRDAQAGPALRASLDRALARLASRRAPLDAGALELSHTTSPVGALSEVEAGALRMVVKERAR